MKHFGDPIDCVSRWLTDRWRWTFNPEHFHYLRFSSPGIFSSARFKQRWSHWKKTMKSHCPLPIDIPSLRWRLLSLYNQLLPALTSSTSPALKIESGSRSRVTQKKKEFRFLLCYHSIAHSENKTNGLWFVSLKSKSRNTFLERRTECDHAHNCDRCNFLIWKVFIVLNVSWAYTSGANFQLHNNRRGMDGNNKWKFNKTLILSGPLTKRRGGWIECCKSCYGSQGFNLTTQRIKWKLNKTPFGFLSDSTVEGCALGGSVCVQLFRKELNHPPSSRRRTS